MVSDTVIENWENFNEDVEKASTFSLRLLVFEGSLQIHIILDYTKKKR